MKCFLILYTAKNDSMHGWAIVSANNAKAASEILLRQGKLILVGYDIYSIEEACFDINLCCCPNTILAEGATTQGERGEKGDKGDKGDIGISVTSVTYRDEKFIITFDNGDVTEAPTLIYRIDTTNNLLEIPKGSDTYVAKVQKKEAPTTSVSLNKRELLITVDSEANTYYEIIKDGQVIKLGTSKSSKINIPINIYGDITVRTVSEKWGLTSENTTDITLEEPLYGYIGNTDSIKTRNDFTELSLNELIELSDRKIYSSEDTEITLDYRFIYIIIPQGSLSQATLIDGNGDTSNALEAFYTRDFEDGSKAYYLVNQSRLYNGEEFINLDNNVSKIDCIWTM